MGKRRVFGREFKLEAVRLVVERCVKVSEAAKHLGIHENVLRKWVRDNQADSKQSFPGRERMKPDDAEVARLLRELAKTKAERDILSRTIASFSRDQR